MVQLGTNHSQRLNSGKPLGTGCCEWLWSIGTVVKRDPPGVRSLSVYPALHVYVVACNSLVNLHVLASLWNKCACTCRWWWTCDSDIVSEVASSWNFLKSV